MCGACTTVVHASVTRNAWDSDDALALFESQHSVREIRCHTRPRRCVVRSERGGLKGHALNEKLIDPCMYNLRALPSRWQVAHFTTPPFMRSLFIPLESSSCRQCKMITLTASVSIYSE